MQTIVFHIDGMTCQGCVHSIEQALNAQTGVNHIKIDLANHSAEITFDPQYVNIQNLIQTIEDTGFDVQAI